ncbi:DNA-directed RNA polymerase III subunit RPC5 [Smittium culicis]|uniref:DNA-directed RNA polymerase III subunit RPC5 n=1 Tax=Smittium culicis TaxID=133412 RepID=A0A1R1XQJ9_9FUNG|nr:DNA-directed RNA polymerase III subunit RPC5 [Smittium culicis]
MSSIDTGIDKKPAIDLEIDSDYSGNVENDNNTQQSETDSKMDIDIELSKETSKFDNTTINQKNTNQDDLEDDPVISRYPVFLNEKLSKYLHLFQYPLKSSEWIEQQEQQPTNARVKPKAGIVELEIPINTSHMMYSKNKGSKLAAGLRNSGETLNVPTGKLFDVQTWTSAPIAQRSKYMIVAYINGELHLTTLEKISQLRYNLDYLDRLNEKIKSSNKKDDTELPIPSAKQTGKSLQVKIRSSQAEEVLKKQENSIIKIRQRIEEEPWTILEYYDHESEESCAIFNQLLASNRSELECKTSKSDYANKISPSFS